MQGLRPVSTALLCALGLASPAAPQPAAPPPFEIVRTFDNPPVRPMGGLIEVDGALVGASLGGQFDHGTVFRLSPPAMGPLATVEKLYSFTDSDFQEGRGAAVGELLRASNGDLYGLRNYANSNTSAGSIFRLGASGDLTTLHDFSRTDGVVYDQIGGQGPLVEMDQVLYGTLYYGGDGSRGALFRIGLDGSGYEVLHRFAGPEGQRPEGALVAVGGWLYGTASGGGADDAGTLFRVSPSGAFEGLHDFMRSSDGARPRGALVQGPDGLVYGATTALGPGGCGTVFRFDPALPSGLSVLRSFACASAEGTNPEGGMVVVPGADGLPVVFGVTTAFSNAGTGSIYRLSSGGAFTVLEALDRNERCSSQLVRASDGLIYGQCYGGLGWRAGRAFRIDPSSGGVATILPFGVQEGGRTPFALIEGRDGHLYGSARAGGAHNRGVVYRLSRDGAFETLHSFEDGAESWESAPSPYSATPTRSSATFLTHASDGWLYGTRCDGGANHDGSLFRVDLGAAKPEFELLHSSSYGDTTACPHGPLVESPSSPGTFLGTATGGEFHGGTAFRFTPGGPPEGLWERRPLLDYTIFTEPIGRLVERPDGTLYGAFTTWDPNYDFVYGGVFRRAPDGSVTPAHKFTWGGPHGPTSGLVVGPASAGSVLTLYGTSPRGGGSSWGTVYKVSVPEAGPSALTVLRAFAGPDGQGPRAELVRGPDGAYYGTTVLGGQYGYGTVFAVGADEQVTTVHHFDHADGAYPETELVAGTDGSLYGVAPRGGPGGGGVLFRISLAPSVEAGGPYAVIEGAVVTLEATGGDPQGGPLDFAWDLDGDGAFDDASGASVDFATDDPARDGDGVYEVSVRATDATGLSAVAATTVTVANVAPAVSVAPAEQRLAPRQSGAFTITFGDPGPDTWTMHVDFGDGTVEDLPLTSPGLITIAHAWSGPGRYTVRVTLADDDGGSGAAAVTVEVGGGPEDSIRQLIEEVQDLLDRGELRRGQAWSLIGELRLALWLVQLPNGERMAAVMLDLFVLEVDFYVRTGALDPEEGGPLLETARGVIAQLRAP
jgi:uncharacterized repeat protein (TIGR03803 family)